MPYWTAHTAPYSPAYNKRFSRSASTNHTILSFHVLSVECTHPMARKFRGKLLLTSDKGGCKLGGLSYWVFSSDQARLQPQHIPPMTDGEGFKGTYLDQGNSSDWPNQLLVHCPTHRHMLQVGQGIHLLHVREEKPPIANLTKPFVIRFIKSSLILLDRVTEEVVRLPQ